MTNGACQEGYTCAVDENVCLESCVADAQCNLSFAFNRHEGLFAVSTGDLVCNLSTGRCEWAPPAGAAFGAPCESDTDCPADVGVCLPGGHCSTFQCNRTDADGNHLYPCPSGSTCVVIGGNDVALCLGLCDTAEDCPTGVACSRYAGVVEGAAGLCFGICETDDECRTDERCRKGGYTNPNLGTCERPCDPSTGDCPPGRICLAVADTDYGFCRDLGGFCIVDADCLGAQACEVLANDVYGLCIDGCRDDADCGAGLSCRVQSGSDTGVCREPGAACSPSPRTFAGDVVLPLRGDPQCARGEVCSTTVPDELGSCGPME